MVSGNYSSSKSTSSTAPWEAQAPYLKDIYAGAGELAGQGNYRYYPGQTQVGFDQSSTQALGMAQARGRGGSDLTRAAQGQAQDTLSGKYLDPSSNPSLGATYDRGAREMRRGYFDAVNSLGSRMESSGRSGGSSQAVGSNVLEQNFATGLGDYSAKLFGGHYDAERNRQQGAMGQANALANQDYRDISAMRNVGMQREQQAQTQLSDLVERFNFNQYGTQNKLAEFSSLIGAPVMASQAKSTSMSAGGGIMGCWVAAEFFGWFTPKWFAARRWIMELWEGDEADTFRDFYLTHGRALALEIRGDAEQRERWRPFFDSAAERGA